MSKRQCKCLHCQEPFTTDYRNQGRQRYCSKQECQRASKSASQKRWNQKLENRNYFRGHVHVERVREWRKAHPGYGQNRRKKEALPPAESLPPLQDSPPLQETCTVQHTDNSVKNGILSPDAPSILAALQDSLAFYQFVLIGLISQITGLALQDDIDRAIHIFLQFGQDIRSGNLLTTGENSDRTQSPLPRSPAPSARAIQLARPSIGAG